MSALETGAKTSAVILDGAEFLQALGGGTRGWNHGELAVVDTMAVAESPDKPGAELFLVVVPWPRPAVVGRG